ncbi:UDP-glycosyltransferase 86A1-like [Andrographis paniculata]|uniref:UDP-glycosyltransferase 86A1-like n=1 Tax=Andrographis paniculata TaxID=175694 RepID=UPI0021E93B15|nr:UDP-glycosyltransferase 86A1-like [Andrographis paniculata]
MTKDITMADAAGKPPPPHVLMLPYPLQGHVIPFVNLAVKLAAAGFTVTFINTDYIHRQISSSAGGGGDLFAEARKSGLDIRYTTVSDGFPVEFDRSLHHDQFFEGIVHVFSAHVDELVGNLRRRDPSIGGMIFDTFYVWPSAIAEKHNLANISFFTEPALVFTLYYHIDLLRRHRHFAASENREDAIDYIPGVKSIMPTDLMSYLQAKIDINTTPHRIIQKAFNDVKKADFILCNTVDELEPDTIAALRRRQPFYAVGPIFPPTFTATGIATSFWSESDCADWLAAKPSRSVLYVSFGSYAHASRREIAEIAGGLALSGVDFIWVLRPDIVSSGETDILPAGFEEEMAASGRGLVVPWCRQMAVLANPAVGGFLTHCGWNSILESIWCGIPMICYPLLTDQFTNRKLVVDDLKIGINLCDGRRYSESNGDGDCVVWREGVCEKIKRLMSSELQKEVIQVRKVLEEAAMDGSSARNFQCFLRDLKGKIAANNNN